MFLAKYYGSKSIKAKSGETFYLVTLVVDTIEGEKKPLEMFCSERAYAMSQDLEVEQVCKVGAGVDKKGRLKVNAIKAFDPLDKEPA